MTTEIDWKEHMAKLGADNLQHSTFYYPYAAFSDDQLKLLKAVALWFDKLYILDPEKATGGIVGMGQAADAVKLLEREGILERVAPQDVLQEHADAIEAAIRADCRDPEFMKLCAGSGRPEWWTLALAKVPQELREDPKFRPVDEAMRRLLGDVPRKIAPELANHAYAERLSSTQVYDEGGPNIEYRYAQYPLPVGESIMVNHALFGGLLHAQAAPITEDPFHHRVLAWKMARAYQTEGAVRDALEDKATARGLKASLFAATALRDRDLKLPALSPKVPLDEVLEYRRKHEAELGAARERLARLSRRIREEPWTPEFWKEVDADTTPKLQEELDACGKARDAWVDTKKDTFVRALGMAAGAAAGVLALVTSTTPLLPVGIGLAALSGIEKGGVPIWETFQKWKAAKAGVQENGLHYLLSFQT